MRIVCLHFDVGYRILLVSVELWLVHGKRVFRSFLSYLKCRKFGYYSAVTETYSSQLTWQWSALRFEHKPSVNSTRTDLNFTINLFSLVVTHFLDRRPRTVPAQFRPLLAGYGPRIKCFYLGEPVGIRLNNLKAKLS